MEEDFLNEISHEDLHITKTKQTQEPSPYHIAGAIMDGARMITRTDTSDIYRYVDGVYLPDARPMIGNTVQHLLGEEASAYLTNEVIGHIQRTTYMDPTIAKDGTEFVNLMNGVVNVLTGEWTAHSPEVVFFKQLPFAYDPKAECPRIDTFISEVFTSEDVELAYEAIAYCLVPGYPIQKAFALIGEGANGKSTYLGLIKTFLGHESVSSVSLQDLDADKFSGASLYGKKANICADLPAKGLARTSMFKTLTGGDRVRVQFKFKNAFDFENSAKLLFSMNQLPLTDDESDAFYRRWVIIDFPNRFEGDKANTKKLTEITQTGELAGLFNKCLKVIPTLLERKTFCQAGATEETRLKYRRLSDSVFTYLETNIVIKNGAYDETSGRAIEEPGIIRKSALYAAYKGWCEQQKPPAIPVRDRVFNKRLLEYAPGVSDHRIKSDGNARAWKGIDFRDPEDAKADEQTILTGGV